MPPELPRPTTARASHQLVFEPDLPTTGSSEGSGTATGSMQTARAAYGPARPCSVGGRSASVNGGGWPPGWPGRVGGGGAPRGSVSTRDTPPCASTTSGGGLASSGGRKLPAVNATKRNW